jgi:hypothetical protein
MPRHAKSAHLTVRPEEGGGPPPTGRIAAPAMPCRATPTTRRATPCHAVPHRVETCVSRKKGRTPLAGNGDRSRRLHPCRAMPGRTKPRRAEPSPAPPGLAMWRTLRCTRRRAADRPRSAASQPLPRPASPCRAAPSLAAPRRAAPCCLRLPSGAVA